MGAGHSTGKALLQVCSGADGDPTPAGRALLEENAAASCYVSCVHRLSPLLVASGVFVWLGGRHGGRRVRGVHKAAHLRAAAACVRMRIVACGAACVRGSWRRLSSGCLPPLTCCLVGAPAAHARQTPLPVLRSLPLERVRSCASPPSPLHLPCTATHTTTARGHTRLCQAIIEAAVLSQGLTRAKQRCINHINARGHSALMVACMNG
jgi:hypothetical protein